MLILWVKKTQAKLSVENISFTTYLNSVLAGCVRVLFHVPSTEVTEQLAGSQRSMELGSGSWKASSFVT